MEQMAPCRERKTPHGEEKFWRVSKILLFVSKEQNQVRTVKKNYKVKKLGLNVDYTHFILRGDMTQLFWEEMYFLTYFNCQKKKKKKDQNISLVQLPSEPDFLGNLHLSLIFR